MYIYIYVYIYVYIHTHVHVCIYVYVCICVRIYTFTQIHTCMYIHIHVCAYTCMYIHVYKCVYTGDGFSLNYIAYMCMCVNICVCVFKYPRTYTHLSSHTSTHPHVHNHIHIYIHIYIHIHIPTQVWHRGRRRALHQSHGLRPNTWRRYYKTLRISLAPARINHMVLSFVRCCGSCHVSCTSVWDLRSRSSRISWCPCLFSSWYFVFKFVVGCCDTSFRV